jgi:hypothetical protein
MALGSIRPLPYETPLWGEVRPVRENELLRGWRARSPPAI